MKTIATLLTVATASLLLVTASSAHAGHERSFRLVCELERETDHLFKDLKHDYRHRGYPTCSRSTEGRLFRAIKELEEQTDTLHYRIRKNRSSCSQAEAFAAIRCTFEQASDLLCRVRLEQHTVDVIREVGCRIERLAREFDHHGHASASASASAHTAHQLHNHRPQRFDESHPGSAAGAAELRIEAVLLARLFQAVGL